MNDAQVISELEPVVEQLLERHLSTSKEWFPHEHIPHGRGRDIEPGHVWSEDDADLGGATLDDEVRSALYVNLLTEDNLPYYFRSLESAFGRDGAWGTWVRRWTAEEGRHSMVIYGYLAATQAMDLVDLERGRMAQVSRGETPDHDSLHELFVYLSLQELATRISHRNTGRRIGDPVGYEVMARVCADENLHQLFYRDLAAAALELDADAMMIALEHQVRTFAMPGTGIPGFDEHAARIARAGIYDLQIHHEQILVPIVMRQWAADEITGLGPDGQRAQERLMKRMATSERVAKRYAERRAETQSSDARDSELQPV